MLFHQSVLTTIVSMNTTRMCAELVRIGQKTASCSMELWYSEHGEPMPEVGHLQVVTNWDGEPVCVIQMTDVSTCRYDEVTAEFAYAEGEGDRTLNWWRDAHAAFLKPSAMS